MKKTIRHGQSGASLMAVISIMTVLVFAVGIAAEYTMKINRSVQRANTMEQALAVGDATIETLFTNWRAICRIAPTAPVASSSLLGVIPLPTTSQFPTLPSVANFAKGGTDFTTSDEYDSTYTISNIKVVAVDATYSSLSSADDAPIPAVGLAQTGTANSTSAVYN